jgi:peptidoglycan hydrolase-like protein with peptidoglycan-binding domain
MAAAAAALALAISPAFSQNAANPHEIRYRRSNQKAPTPDRYKEIQQALVDRGYLEGPADGKWGPESVEALRHFQRDQNLLEDGKLGALTLTALGLGPKRTEALAAAKTVKPAQAPADE